MDAIGDIGQYSALQIFNLIVDDQAEFAEKMKRQLAEAKKKYELVIRKGLEK